MRVRIRDIAKLAGVSAATVSNALNGKAGVGDDTSKRIHSIAREMGYLFDKPVSPMKDYVRLVCFKRHGLVVMDTQFFAEMMEALERQCHKYGLGMIVSNIHMQRDSDYHQRISDICREECAGILLLATEMYPEDVDLFSHTKAPLLILDSLFRNKPFNCVVMNNFEAGYSATNRLIRAGHTHIEHITSSVRFNNMRYRREGYESAMEDAGFTVLRDAAVWQVTPTLEGSYRDMRDLIRQRTEPLPTAFFAANDIIAVGCVRAMKERGIKIPQDISIIGMDDLDICQITDPALSTIRVFREDIARVAVHRLMEMINEDTSHCIQKTEVSVALVDRKSVCDIRDI